MGRVMSETAFTLSGFKEHLEPIPVDMPNGTTINLWFRPNAVKRGDLQNIAFGERAASDMAQQSDEHLVRSIARWDIRQDAESDPLPVTLETLHGLPQFVYSRISEAVWRAIQGNLPEKGRQTPSR
jgi:hypothetical protein